MTPVQFGWTMPTGLSEKQYPGRYLDVLRQGLDMIKGTYDSAWLIDHLQFDDREVVESWTALTYLAAQHPELRFGHAVLCQSFRNPALVAKMGATLQFLSGGRLILGLGAGWHEEEYKAYGYDFPAAGMRVAQMRERTLAIKALWTQERATFTGTHYRIEDAVCEPKPDPLPPVMIGAFGPKMLRLTAHYADWWNVSSTSVESYRRMVRDFEHACLDVGRDPSQVRRTWGGGCVCAPTWEAAAIIGGDRYLSANPDDFDFVGTPRQIVEQMRPFIDLGVDYFMLDCGGFPDLTTLELLVGEVLPTINSSP